ncbi:hypothetical protein JDV02_007282 [Purpureocillium takamizusanense]|uniref:Major facilitator superfamily (MFS) profile domain-containing protein n=1 Tax=Purpureocillium takamizusanense TaxID=2060973 RepID=A0A9Q8QKD4_9HYPO|nr:uncharacterized protein JDV02_007282 [Purpureocillium takamizusanense]UNI21280.1 hypothetical protein JDV02_007282 [Purpureocillium takamizusanense]
MGAADASSVEQKSEHDAMSDSKQAMEKVASMPSETANVADEDERSVKLSGKTIMAVTAVCLIYFAQLTILVGVGAQGQTIAGHFNATDKVSWLSAPITIFTVVLCPMVSQACDYWGRKWFLTILVFIGALGALIIAQAKSINMIIAGVSVMGVAFGNQPLLHAVVSEVLPRRWRGYGQGGTAAANSMGSVFGVVVGAALNRTNDPTKDGFRTYFYIVMAVHIVAGLLTLVGYNPPPTKKQKEFRGRTMDKLRTLDWGGFALLAAGLTLFCLALSWSQNPYPWSEPHVCATFAVGMAFALGLVVYETWFVKEGMFHHGLFNMGRNFPICLFCIFTDGIAFFAANLYFAFEVNMLYEKDTMLVNARLVVWFVACIVGAMATGLWCARFRNARWLTVCALLLMTISFALFSKADRSTNNAVWGYAVPLGIGLGMSITTLVTIAQLSTPPGLIALASGLMISVRSIGATCGIAIYNAIFVAEMSHLGDNVAHAAISHGLNPQFVGQFIGALTSRNETLMAMIPNVTGEIIEAGADALVGTYNTGFDHVWIAAASFAALAALSAAFLYDPVKEFNMRVDAPMEEKSEEESVI